MKQLSGSRRFDLGCLVHLVRIQVAGSPGRRAAGRQMPSQVCELRSSSFWRERNDGQMLWLLCMLCMSVFMYVCIYICLYYCMLACMSVLSVLLGTLANISEMSCTKTDKEQSISPTAGRTWLNDHHNQMIQTQHAPQGESKHVKTSRLVASSSRTC